MREIRFRGRYVFEANALYPAQNKWVCGFLYIEDGKYWIKDGRKTYCVIKESVGQYAGLKDKNGVEIYEGDIVTTTVPPGKELHEVKFEDGCFVIEPEGSGHYGAEHTLFSNNYQAVVIGNVYENPELLESKK